MRNVPVTGLVTCGEPRRTRIRPTCITPRSVLRIAARAIGPDESPYVYASSVGEQHSSRALHGLDAQYGGWIMFQKRCSPAHLECTMVSKSCSALVEGRLRPVVRNSSEVIVKLAILSLTFIAGSIWGPMAWAKSQVVHSSEELRARQRDSRDWAPASPTITLAARAMLCR